MYEIETRAWTPEDRAWGAEQAQRLFGGTIVISRGRTHRPLELDGYCAFLNGARTGLATYAITGDECELVTLDSLVQWQGVGTALMREVERAAAAAGCRRLWLITTNDNIDALRFYQRRGFCLAAVHAGALEHSRKLKPAIPLTGHYGIPLTDELELHKLLV